MIYLIRAWPDEHDFCTKDICIKTKTLSCLRYYMKYIISIILKQAAREAWVNVGSQRTPVAFVLFLWDSAISAFSFHTSSHSSTVTREKRKKKFLLLYDFNLKIQPSDFLSDFLSFTFLFFFVCINNRPYCVSFLFVS